MTLTIDSATLIRLETLRAERDVAVRDADALAQRLAEVERERDDLRVHVNEVKRQREAAEEALRIARSALHGADIDELPVPRRIAVNMAIGSVERVVGPRSDDETDLFYIQDTRVFTGNAATWWRPEGKGYTTHIDKAGRFTLEDARSWTSRDTDRLWPCSYVDGLWSAHVDQQHLDPRRSMPARKGAGE